MKSYTKPEMEIAIIKNENIMTVTLSNVNTLNIKKNSEINVINF